MGGFNPNRHLKEEFVSNLQGSSMLEIAALSAVVPAFVVFRMSLYPFITTRKKNSGLWSTLALDFSSIVLPTLLCLTLLADYVYVITLAVLFVIGMIMLFNSQPPRNADSVFGPSKKLFLKYYRFVMMLVTCVTILAVDFSVFPRRYGKTETYGTGLMDLGVGSFVAANAIVSREARSGTNTAKVNGIVRSVAPLLIIGFVRILATRGVDYQVHVGEYGVHWNFFFTLAAVSLLTSLIRIPAAYCGFLGTLILAVHQISLLCGLNTYILSPDRSSGLIHLNKEGLFSITGYWSLYLLSVYLGHRLFFNSAGSSKLGVWLLDGALWLLVNLLDRFVENVSRRTCNMAYVVLVLAQNLEVVGIFACSEAFFPVEIKLLQAFDNNLLLTFLVANLLTGLVNLSMDTIFVPPLPAFVVLVGYQMLLVVVVGVFQMLNIRAKFW